MAQKGLGASRGCTSEQKEFNIVAVGDAACGKTALITTYTTGVFPEVSKTLCDSHKIVKYCSTEDFDRLRPMSYRNVDVVLICYDVMSPATFENVFHRWYPEVQHFCARVPIILVGCKTDLRSDKFLEEKLWSLGQNAIMYTQGEEARRKISAVAYLECSAKCNENVDDVFREATKQALMVKRVKDRVTKSGSPCASS
uniref:Ras homolog family member F, filopodia associated n=1 Tax=Amphiprion percula TaxID=161767 RepID=A0A3P8SUV2_AMPPE